MSALTQETFRAVEVKLSPEQVEARRREAEKILGRKLPPRPATETTGKRDK